MKSIALKGTAIVFSLLLFAVAFYPSGTKAAGELTLYTPATHVAVSPGETINYELELTNRTERMQNAALSAANLPVEWTYKFTSRGRNVKEVAVKPGETHTVDLDLEIPLQVEKGEYRFTVSAGNGNTLPLVVEVTEQGTYETEFTTELPNIEGHNDSTFTYSGQLRNRTAEDQLYALRADAGAGWDVVFSVGGERVSSVNVAAGSTETVSIRITPPQQVEPGTFTIPITADANAASAVLELQTSIKGSYGMELTTPSGLLSTDITAGNSRKLEAVVRNTGTLPLHNVQLSANTPVQWTVEFEPKSVDTIPPGEERTVTATIASADTSLAGDYVVNMTASTPEADAGSQIRVSVKTSVVWGWVGILAIAAVCAALLYLFRKYGRR